MKTYPISIGYTSRQLPIIKLPSGVSVALFDLTEDSDLIVEAAAELIGKIPKGTEVLVMPEGKALGLLLLLALDKDLPTVVLRKKKGYLQEPILEHSVSSITTERTQVLYLGAAQVEKVRGKKCLFVDDVISRGDTLKAGQALLAQAGAELIGAMAVFTEGEPRPDVLCLGHLPIWAPTLAPPEERKYFTEAGHVCIHRSATYGVGNTVTCCDCHTLFLSHEWDRICREKQK